MLEGSSPEGFTTPRLQVRKISLSKRARYRISQDTPPDSNNKPVQRCPSSPRTLASNTRFKRKTNFVSSRDWADDADDVEDPSTLPPQQILNNKDGTKTIISQLLLYTKEYNARPQG